MNDSIDDLLSELSQFNHVKPDIQFLNRIEENALTHINKSNKFSIPFISALSAAIILLIVINVFAMNNYIDQLYTDSLIYTPDPFILNY